MVVEVKEFDQYAVKVDGTGRLTLRNRKFLRSYQPIKRQGTHLPPVPSQQSLEPEVQVPTRNTPTLPIPAPEEVIAEKQTISPSFPALQPSENLARPDEVVPTHSQAVVPTPIVPSEVIPTPAVTTPAATTPTTSSPSPRPQRYRKSNPKYSPELWDLSPVHYIPGYQPRV